MDDLKPTLIFLAVCIPFFIGTVWAVLDVAQKSFGTSRRKALWWLVASVPFAGFIVYLLFGLRKGQKLDA
jgi:hypothetical protein